MRLMQINRICILPSHNLPQSCAGVELHHDLDAQRQLRALSKPGPLYRNRMSAGVKLWANSQFWHFTGRQSSTCGFFGPAVMTGSGEGIVRIPTRALSSSAANSLAHAVWDFFRSDWDIHHGLSHAGRHESRAVGKVPLLENRPRKHEPDSQIRQNVLEMFSCSSLTFLLQIPAS